MRFPLLDQILRVHRPSLGTILSFCSCGAKSKREDWNENLQYADWREHISDLLTEKLKQVRDEMQLLDGQPR